MGFSLFGKKKDKSGKSASSPKTKPADFRKQYPFLANVKIPEVVPAVTLNMLKDTAHGDETQMGAVREAGDKSGYLVAMISEQELINVGFNTKNSKVSSGQFIQGIKKHIIKSATLRNDLNNGFMTIIPNSEALNYLGRIPECQRLKYQLALFPAAIDDEDTLACEPLKLLGNNNDDGLASYGDLTSIADKGQELVINREKGTVAPQDFVETTNDEDDEDVDPAGELSSGGTLEDYDDIDVDVDEDDDDDILDASYDDADDATPSAADTTDSTSADAPEASSFDMDSAMSEIDNDDDYDVDSLLQDADPTYNPSDDNPALDDSSEDVDEEPEYSEDEAKDYASNVNALADKEIDLSSDLGLNASSNDITSFLDADVPHIELFDSGDNELQKRLNVLRSTLNNKVSQYVVDKRKTRVVEYTEELNNLVNKVYDEVDVDKNEELKSAYADLKADYKENEDRTNKEISRRTNDIRADYDRDKKEFVDAAAKQAAVEYESRHKSELTQSIKDVEKDLGNKAIISYNQGLLALNERRKTAAQTSFNTGKANLVAKIREEVAADNAEVQKLYEQFKDDVNKELEESYAREVQRANNMKDVADHDGLIDKLNKQLEETKAQNETDMDALKAELDADYTKKLDNKSEEISHLKENVDNLKTNYESQISTLKSQHTANIDSYEKNINNLQDQYREKMEENKLDYEKYSTTRRNHIIMSIVSTAVVGLLLFVIGIVLGGHNNSTAQTATQSGAPTYILPSQQAAQQSSATTASSTSSTATQASSNTSSSTSSESSHSGSTSENDKASAKSDSGSHTETHNESKNGDTVDNH